MGGRAPDRKLIELIDCENDVVAAHVGRHVRGKASGVEAEFEWWGVFTFSNGKLLRSELLTDRAQALEAAGLSE